MFGLGQSRRFGDARATSALPPIATKLRTSREVRFVPISEVPDATLRRIGRSSGTILALASELGVQLPDIAALSSSMRRLGPPIVSPFRRMASRSDVMEQKTRTRLW